MKLTIAKFINTAIIPIIINREFNTWMVEGGLTS